jgi:hypothetical protein
MIDKLALLSRVVSAIGPLKEWCLQRRGRHLAVSAQEGQSWFAREMDKDSALVVLWLNIDNTLSTEVAVRGLRQAILADHRSIDGQQCASANYTVSWGTSVEICDPSERLDTRIEKSLPIRGHSSACGYALFHFPEGAADSRFLRCKVTLAPSRGAPVVEEVQVERCREEVHRARVRVLQPVALTVNRRRFRLAPSGHQVVPIFRFLYDNIQNQASEKDKVQWVEDFELGQR